MTTQKFDQLPSLLSAHAVRQRCHRLGNLALSGQSRWFEYEEQKFSQCVDFVGEICLNHYPDLNIPLHSRWRHFEIGATNLWQHYTQDFTGSKLDLSRSAIDLVFLSVLLDAGAGEQWHFNDPVSGQTLSRSEGLAAASIEIFFKYASSFDEEKGWQLDSRGLNQLNTELLCEAFQHSASNSLLGIEGRLNLLHGLARVLQVNDDDEDEIAYRRPGDIIDECQRIAKLNSQNIPVIKATDILSIVLNRFGSIWPSGYKVQNRNLGDCGYHSLLVTNDETSGIIPFHKLSQWLSYSLIEPLQWAGFEIIELDGLTGLPEYRNGGLLIDTGVLRPIKSELLTSQLSLQSEAVVEWRALTVFTLDRLATSLREKLNLDENQLPLASVLQGGTWAAGREIASRLRPDATPPLNLAIDGTIF